MTKRSLMFLIILLLTTSSCVTSNVTPTQFNNNVTGASPSPTNVSQFFFVDLYNPDKYPTYDPFIQSSPELTIGTDPFDMAAIYPKPGFIGNTYRFFIPSEVFAKLSTGEKVSFVLPNKIASYDFGTLNKNKLKNDTLKIALPLRPRKEAGLAKLKDLRAISASEIRNKVLDQAIADISASLDDKLWLDGAHLQPDTGATVFDKEKEAADLFMQGEQLLSAKDLASGAELIQGFIHDVDRDLAITAIDEATLSGKNSDQVFQAKDELSKGDKALGDKQFSAALAHYRDAWQKALHASEGDNGQ